MKRKISFGKYAIGSMRKINEVVVELELRDTDRGPEFSACCDVWNGSHTDIVRGGQCLDTVQPYVNNPLFNEIVWLWERNHLNGMNAGTAEQMKCIADHKDEINEEDGFYYKELNLLKKYNMDVVEYEGEPYKYGTSWIYRPISDADLKRIKEIMERGIAA